jgi:hypothetical protein
MVESWRLEYLSRSTVTAGIQLDEMQSICLEVLKLRNQSVPPAGYALVPIEPTENMIIAGFESKPSAFNSSTEELEECESMNGCEEAAHLAKLCWKAMVDSAPDINGLGE